MATVKDFSELATIVNNTNKETLMCSRIENLLSTSPKKVLEIAAELDQDICQILTAGESAKVCNKTVRIYAADGSYKVITKDYLKTLFNQEVQMSTIKDMDQVINHVGIDQHDMFNLNVTEFDGVTTVGVTEKKNLSKEEKMAKDKARRWNQLVYDMNIAGAKVVSHTLEMGFTNVYDLREARPLTESMPRMAFEQTAEYYCNNKYCTGAHDKVMSKLIDTYNDFKDNVTKHSLVADATFNAIDRKYDGLVVTQPQSEFNGKPNLLSGKLMYTLKKDGGYNQYTINAFKYKYGNNARKAWEIYCNDEKVYREAAAEAFSNIYYRKLAVRIMRKANNVLVINGDNKIVARERFHKQKNGMLDVTPNVVDAETLHVHMSEESVKVCPFCGEELVMAVGGHNDHYSVTKDTVLKELKSETIEVSDDRTVTINSNGYIIDDSTDELAGLFGDCGEADEDFDFSTYTDRSDATDEYDNKFVEDTYFGGSEAADFVEGLITEEDMDEFYEMNAISGEAVNTETVAEYNARVRSHKAEAKYNTVARAYGIRMAGELLKTDYMGLEELGGFSHEFYAYETEVMDSLSGLEGDELIMLKAGLNAEAKDTRIWMEKVGRLIANGYEAETIDHLYYCDNKVATEEKIMHNEFQDEVRASIWRDNQVDDDGFIINPLTEEECVEKYGK